LWRYNRLIFALDCIISDSNYCSYWSKSKLNILSQLKLFQHKLKVKMSDGHHNKRID